jgi:hypothetical protein
MSRPTAGKIRAGKADRTSRLARHAKGAKSAARTSRLTHASSGRIASSKKKARARGFIVDLATGQILKSFALAQPALLPGKKKAASGKKSSGKPGSAGRHVTRAATIEEARAQLGMSKRDVERAQGLLLELKF